MPTDIMLSVAAENLETEMNLIVEEQHRVSLIKPLHIWISRWVSLIKSNPQKYPLCWIFGNLLSVFSIPFQCSQPSLPLPDPQSALYWGVPPHFCHQPPPTGPGGKWGGTAVAEDGDRGPGAPSASSSIVFFKGTFQFLTHIRRKIKPSNYHSFLGDHSHRSGTGLPGSRCHCIAGWVVVWCPLWYREWEWGGKEEEKGKRDLRQVQRVWTTDWHKGQQGGECDCVWWLFYQPEMLTSVGQCTLHWQPPVCHHNNSAGEWSQGHHCKEASSENFR